MESSKREGLPTLHFKKPPFYGQNNDESEILITKLEDNSFGLF